MPRFIINTFLIMLVTFSPLSGAAESSSTATEASMIPSKFEAFPDLLYTYNTNLLLSTAFNGINYSSADMYKAISELKPAGLRFPGGTIGNNYLWKEDNFSEQPGDKTKWAAQALRMFRKSGQSYDLPGYIELCKRKNLVPIYMLNIYEETPESTIELVQMFEDKGLPLKYLELGNEPFWDPRSHNDVTAYIKFSKPIALALRERFPDLMIGACFGPFNRRGKYETRWNNTLAKEDFYDAIIHHEYFGGQGIAVDEGSDAALNELLFPDGFISHIVEESRDHDRKDMPIWITEWNVGLKGLKQWKNSGAEIMFLGAVFHELMENSKDVTIASFHQIYQGNFGTFEFNKETGQVDYMPCYQFFELLGDLWEGAKGMHVVDAGKEAPVLSVAIEKDDAVEWMVVNRASDSHKIENWNLPKGAKLYSIHCEDLVEKLPFNKDLIVESTAPGDVAPTIAPYSVNRIVIPR